MWANEERNLAVIRCLECGRKKLSRESILVELEINLTSYFEYFCRGACVERWKARKDGFITEIYDV